MQRECQKGDLSVCLNEPVSRIKSHHLSGSEQSVGLKAKQTRVERSSIQRVFGHSHNKYPPPSSPLPPLPSLRLVLKILYKVIRNIRKFRLETCELGVAVSVTNDQVRLPRSTQRNNSAVQRRGAHFALP